LKNIVLFVSAGEVKLGSMAPDTPKLALHLPAWLFHITHDFYHYELMTSSKISAHATEWAPQKCFQSGPALAKAGPVCGPLPECVVPPGLYELDTVTEESTRMSLLETAR